MVNGYISSQQIQPQTYQKPQALPQSQVVENCQIPQETATVSNSAVPYQYMNPSYAPQLPLGNQPTGSTSAVSINIISPAVYGQNQAKAEIPYSSIYNYPQATQPIQASMSPVVPATLPKSQETDKVEEPKQEKIKKKNIVPLTDDYIKTVENYMKNSNEQVRIMGAKEVMARFKEDDSRKNDAALTALLNMALQDKNNNVRLIAMTTVASGYSSGDDNTAILLNKIQQQTSNYSEDALLASNALMKMSSSSQKVEVQEK